MKQLKIGDRVKIKSAGKSGMIEYRNIEKPDTYDVNLDEGGFQYRVPPNNLIRLRKKKAVKQEGKAGAMTREELAAVWDKWIAPLLEFDGASASPMFKSLCKELGL